MLWLWVVPNPRSGLPLSEIADSANQLQKRQCKEDIIFLNVYECRYLWFFMECILARGDNYNFTKKLAENIKHTKDANAEETDSTNHVCKFYS